MSFILFYYCKITIPIYLLVSSTLQIHVHITHIIIIIYIQRDHFIIPYLC